MSTPALERVPYRLRPEAVYLRDLGYVFIDLDGRLFRMDEEQFDALRRRCIDGMPQGDIQGIGALIVECESTSEAEVSFEYQNLLAQRE